MQCNGAVIDKFGIDVSSMIGDVTKLREEYRLGATQFGVSHRTLAHQGKG